MSHPPRLTFPSWDGTEHVRLGHGDNCVLVMHEKADFTAGSWALALTPQETRALARAMIRQAGHAERVHLERERYGG